MGDFELPSSEQLTISISSARSSCNWSSGSSWPRRRLARAAGNVSLVSAPIPQSPRLRHIELVALQPRLGLVILVTTDGAVRQVMVHWPEDADQETLSPLADNLASSLRGLTADEVPPGRGRRPGWHGGWTRSRRIARHDGERRACAPFRVEHVLSQPEFSDAAEAQEAGPAARWIVSARDAAAPGRRPGRPGLHRAREPADELRRLGVVVSTYGVDGEVIGVLGVVGPTRMAYDRSISSVRYMARLMSDLMADLGVMCRGDRWVPAFAVGTNDPRPRRRELMPRVTRQRQNPPTRRYGERSTSVPDADATETADDPRRRCWPNATGTSTSCSERRPISPTIRRRIEQERAQQRLAANEQLLREIVPVLDDLQRGLSSLPPDQQESKLAEGMRWVEQKFLTTLKKHGVTPIEALGQPFDPSVHEAVEADPAAADTVVAVYAARLPASATASCGRRW